ncbi:MAG: B12-binding domain-containing radical SAM protein [Oligoflexales bacterium]|nr:B12-binding domain-containing radical SAM protein [Oligoflexales bacterium]
MINALLVYPKFTPSYWSGTYALGFIGIKALMPPLGLLSIASLFPKHYKLELVDMNVEPLTDQHLKWADYLFLSAMIVQQQSFKDVVKRGRAAKIPIIAGGPYPTSFYTEITGVDYFVLGEVEEFFEHFLMCLEKGTAVHLNTPPRDNGGKLKRPDISAVPPPNYDLIKMNDYNSMTLQFSRGCPFNCEFCDITKLFGRIPRTKGMEQVIDELQNLYDHGWRRSVFFVDDNFIGNRKKTHEVLPAIIEWQKERGYPFTFFTEASADLSENPKLMDAMADAGFDMVFLGLETPDTEGLRQIGKRQNIRHDEPDYLLHVVREIQKHGMEVSAGFIIGLDSDKENIFDSQVSFIQQAGIPMAMVGLLTAFKGTKLYKRLMEEKRLISESNGNNVSFVLNFIPKMERQTLIEGYKRVLGTIYDSSLCNYFERSYTLLKNWNRHIQCTRHLERADIVAFFKSLKIQLFSRQGPAYLKFLVRVVVYRPKLFAEAIRLAIMGYHYQKVTSQQILVDEFRAFIEDECRIFNSMMDSFVQYQGRQKREMQAYLGRRLSDVKKRYRKIDNEFRASVDDALNLFHQKIRNLLGSFF